jgi:hypothetical protein
VGRLTTLAQEAIRFDNTLSREYLQEAMASARRSDNEEFRPVHRRIIDMAHGLSEEFAASLASLFDDDPARTKTRIALKEQLNQLKVQKAIAEGGVDRIVPEDKGDVSQAAWRLLGQLNGGRTPTVELERARAWLELAGGMPLHRAYPILAWAITHATRRFDRTPQAPTTLRPFFETAMQSCELAARLTERAAGRGTALRVAATSKPSVISDSHRIIEAGERKEALEFIRQWMVSGLGSYLKIADPYLGPAEVVELLKVVLEIRPGCEVLVLSSIANHKKILPGQPDWQEEYSRQWSINSSREAPRTEIMVVGYGSAGEPPIHDRWFVTEGSGMTLGTSFNSLGQTKAAEISIDDEERAAGHERVMDRYFDRVERFHKGEKLTYRMILLP